jgi:type I restriction-modification system DNA methylase subunit
MKSRGGKQNGILPEEFNQRGGNGGGEIDVLVTNLIKNKRTILVIEDKVGIKNHQSKMDFNECDQSKDYAVDGALFYAGALSKKFNVVALAISANSESDFLISGYRIEKNSTKINELFSNQTTIKQIDDYLEIDPYKDEIKKLSLMDDVEFQKEIDNIGKELSGQLDAVVEAEDRPGFMSIILLGLYNKRGSTKRFSQLIVDDEPDKMALCSELKDVINKRLSFMPEEKRKFALGVVDDIKQNKKADEIFIKNFAKRVMNEVLPLFEVERKFDVVGKFYQIFLKYTNQGDKKNGVVLTPHHITNLFADLVKWKDDASDTIFDPCCGSGAFVISGMRKLLDINNKNNLHKYIDHLTGKQLLGNELMPKIYGLCVANMLFHDDGKSNILNEDFFSEEFDIQYKKIKESGGREDATIGFVNPPYSGTAKNLDELTKIRNGDKKNSKSAKIREIEFFRKLCSLCSRYAVMIAPLSVFSSESDKDGRKQILQLGKLKAMIKMPDELFSETISVGTQTYICVVDLMNGKHNHEKD